MIEDPFRRYRNLGFAGVMAALAITYVVVGSHDFAARTNDSAFLRPVSPTVAPITSDDLWPFRPHSRWTMEVTTSRARGNVNQVVLGRRPRPGGQLVIVEDQWPHGMKSRRAYLVTPHGLGLLATGSGRNAFFDPPLPLLSLPLQLDHTGYWSGTERIGQQPMPARAAVRLSGPDPITTEAGNFTAYRLDLLMQTGTGKSAIGQHSTLWLAPGVGIVREQQGTGENTVLSQLVRYDPT